MKIRDLLVVFVVALLLLFFTDCGQNRKPVGSESKAATEVAEDQAAEPEITEIPGF